MGELVNADWSAVLDAIVDGAQPWSTAAELAQLLIWELDHVETALNELASSGLVASWTTPDGGLAWTLTPLSADGLNVHIVEYGMCTRHRWERREREPIAAGPRRGGNEGFDPDAIADPSPGPDAIAERNDVAAWNPRRRRTLDELPRPTVLLAGCATTWSERGRKSTAVCPACKDLPLAPNVCCLRCLRWGLDHVLMRRRPAKAKRNAG